MTGKGHVKISSWLCQTVGIVVFNDFTPFPLILGGLASLLPDIDENKSKISYMLIKGFGGKERIKGVNHSFTDKKHNKRVKFFRQSALSTILIGIAAILFYLKINIFFSIASLYLAILPWTPHRGISHSLFSVAMFGGSCILGFNSYNMIKYGIYIALGYFFHLAEDMLTVSGVPYLYPFSNKRTKFGLMSTGTEAGNKFENFLFVLALITTILSIMVKLSIKNGFL